MQSNSLISGIWKGACRPANAADNQIFKSMIRALVPVQSSIFELDGRSSGADAMLEDIELIPGVALGDILAEELDADVPFGSVVIIRSAEAFTDVSHAVGEALGEILLSVIGRGLFPLADEDNVLYLVGLAYHRAAQSPKLARLGLVPDAFRAGLSGVLAQYWSLPETTTDIFAAGPSAEVLPMQLSELQGRGTAGLSLAAMTSFDAPPTFCQWTLRLKTLAARRQGRRSAPVPHGNVGIS
ncbi:MAG: hypothetical protein CML55_04505 [Rhodobacteraceae bacterium]|nr:hypothetical protein [Paracoccaceae bacterium]MBO29137.1 hypothetical protein [Paracoccaceae bacterium]